MAFCKMCGNEVPDGVAVCPSCGEKIEVEEPKNGTSNNEKTDYSEFFNKIMDTHDSTENFETNDIEENKLISILSYISILFLIPYFARPKSKYARFHANQGCVLFLYSFVIQAVLTALGALPLIDIISGILNAIVAVISVALTIIGICNTCNGEAKELPVIGKYTLIK